MNKNTKGILLAILAAGLYAVSAPISKILLNYLSPTMMAGFLYLGAGIGMGIISLARKINNKKVSETKLSKSELPYIIAMILLDIVAPISLMFGLNITTAENAALLNNFEIVVTALIALLVFKESIGKRLWFGIIFITIASIILSVENIASFKFSLGSLFVLIACICWGFENNCTRKLSNKDPLQIVLLKGVFSGIGSIIIALIIGEKVTVLWSVFVALALGFVAYGLSIFFYIYAQRQLGAAKTSAYYAIAPFIGVLLSLLIFNNQIGINFIIALIIMILGAYLASSDTALFKKRH